MLPVLVRWARGLPVQPFSVLPPPYTSPRLNACLFWRDGRGPFGRRFPVLPPPPRLNDACLSAMAADVPLLCYTPCTAVRISAAHFWLLLLRFVRELPVYPAVRLGAALMLRFW